MLRSASCDKRRNDCRPDGESRDAHPQVSVTVLFRFGDEVTIPRGTQFEINLFGGHVDGGFAPWVVNPNTRDILLRDKRGKPFFGGGGISLQRRILDKQKLFEGAGKDVDFSRPFGKLGFLYSYDRRFKHRLAAREGENDAKRDEKPPEKKLRGTEERCNRRSECVEPREREYLVPE